MVATAAAVVIAGVALVVVTLRHPGTPVSSDTTSTTGATTTGSTATTTTTTVPVVAPDTYTVGTTTLHATDSSVAGQGPRTITVALWYPASAAAAGAAPAPGGPFPLLVFSQGFLEKPTAYAVLLQTWASAGFVVAAPTYPHTDPTQAPTRADLVNHPHDLAAVLAKLDAVAGGGGWVLSGRIATHDVGLVGQSDGGDVSLAAAANNGYEVPNVKAVAILSGAEYAPFGGAYFPPPPTTPPLLVVQGTADTTNPPSCSAQIYNAAPTPKYFLALPGSTHLVPYTSSDAAEAAVAQVTTDFFESTLEGKAAAQRAMATAAATPSVATFTAGGSQPVTGPACPQAP